MKTFSLLILCSLFSYFVQASNADTLKANVKKNSIEIKGTTLEVQTPINKVITLLGKPNRILAVAKKDRVFIYDSLGLTFEVGKDAAQKVERIIVSFNPKGNNRIAQSAFKGVVMINGLRMTANTTSALVAQKTPLKDFNCFSTICSSVPVKASLNLIMDFTDETQKKLMDLIFIMKP